MSPLAKRRRLRPGETDAGADAFLDTIPAWLRAVLGAVAAVFASSVVTCLPVVLAWLTSPEAAGSGGQAVQLGLDVWLLGHAVAIDAPGGGRITMTPWLLVGVPFLFATWAGQWVAIGLDDDAARIPWLGWRTRGDVVRAGLVFAAVYGALGLLVSRVAAPVGFTGSVVGSFVGPAVLALIAFGAALRWEFRDEFPSLAPGFGPWWRARTPLWVRRALGPAGWGIAAFLLVGLAVTLMAILARWGRISELHGELSPGLFGGLAVVLGQLLYLPTGAVWATSWLAGPGFGVGHDSSVTWGASDPGLLPLIPALGALPDPGPLPWWTRLGVLVPIVVGAFIGRQSLGQVTRLASWRAKAQTAAIAVVVAGVGMGIIGAMASGGLGTERLARVGVNPWLFGLATTLEFALGAAAVIAAKEVRIRRVVR